MLRKVIILLMAAAFSVGSIYADDCCASAKAETGMEGAEACPHHAAMADGEKGDACCDDKDKCEKPKDGEQAQSSDSVDETESGS